MLDPTFAVPGTTVRLAGQITGTEGYAEAVASGLLAALNTFADIKGIDAVRLPEETVFGALVSYATDPACADYQPMHVNFGIIPPLEDGKRRSKRDRYAAYSERGDLAMKEFLSSRCDLFATSRC